MWIFPWIKLSWHSCYMWDKFGWLYWFWQFLCEGLSSSNPKGLYYLYAWSCSLCERRASFCMDSLLENFADSYLCFQLALLYSVSYIFFLYRSSSLLLCTVFNSISSSTDEVLLINPYADVFVLGNFNTYQKNWLTYSGETHKLVNSVIIFLSQTTLLRQLTFILRSMTDSHSPALLDLFLSSEASICSTMTFPPLGKSDHVVVSVSIEFPINSKQDVPFIVLLLTILMLIGMVFVIIWEMLHGRISLKSVPLLLLVNFVTGFRSELMHISIVSIRSNLSHLRLQHIKNKSVQQSHASLQNSEAVDVWKVACHPPSRRVVACDDFF